jgi:two-component system cell cycle sensor histidine kinase/response regulator CckA
VIAGVTPMLRRLIGEDVELVSRAAPDLGRVEADPGQLTQIVVNLAVNARDAMPAGGRLTIETANVELDDVFAQLHAEVRPGPYVMLAVSDTGVGMSAEVRAHVFEPFFTTKAPGKGTGLGLATVYGIVKQSNGNIGVYSEPGHGTTFKIYLPRVAAPAADDAAADPAASGPGGTETLLLVEDDDKVRALAGEVLRGRGYVVLEARHGGEALEVARRHRGPIHLCLSDVVMPTMGGPELARRLAAARPDTRVLFMSGYTADAIVRPGGLDEDAAFLSKPLLPAALTAKVREVLDAQPVAAGSG